MKLLKLLTLVICSVMLAVNVQGYFYGSVSEGQTFTYQLTVAQSGTLKLKINLTTDNAFVVMTVKRAGAIIMETGTGGSTTTSAFRVYGGETCTIEVRPEYIGNSQGYANFVIYDYFTYETNHAPEITSISATPAAPVYGNAVTVNVSATDVDNNLSYVKFTKGTSSVNDTAAPYSQTYNSLPAGAHTVTAYAVDAKAASDDASVSITVAKRPITVRANSGTSLVGAAPSNPGITLTGGSMAYGQTLTGIGLSNSFAITSSTPVGSYPLTVNGNPGNYNVTKTPGVWVVQSGNIAENDTDGDGFDDDMERILYGNLSTITGGKLSTSDVDGDLYNHLIEKLGGASDGSFTPGSNWGSSNAPGAGYSGLTLITPTGIVLSVNPADLTVN